MRLTQKLCAQHIGFMFRKHWHVQGKRVARDTGAIDILLKHGFTVKDPLEIVNPQIEQIQLDLFKKPAVDTSSYINCYDFGNNNVFVEGLQQAQVISKSIVLDEFPEKVADAIKNTQLSSETVKNIHRTILASNVFDAYQEKLPKKKVPGKPMYNLPRDYGIPSNRKCHLLITKLIFECDKLNKSKSNLNNKIVNDSYFDLIMKKDENNLRINLKADSLLLNKTGIKPNTGSYDGVIPDLFPMKYTIGLQQMSVPQTEILPFKGIISNYYPNIVFSHYSPEDVFNLYGTPVSQSQFEGRSLMKAFTVAYCKAKTLYGDNKKNLDKPVVVQGIHTDGKRFHFGIFQLNTMDLNESNETKNIWFQTPSLDLFQVCEYEKGRPVLDGYNPDVFKVFNAFYNNS